MPSHIVLVGPRGKDAPEMKIIEEVAKRLPEGFTLKMPKAWDQESLRASAAEAEAIISSRVTREVIQSAPMLRIIQAYGTGVDGIDIDAATERGITVCNAVGENAVWVAEHAMALMLALAKSLQTYQRDLARGIWRKEMTFGLYGRTLGIIGLGSIGTEVAKRAKAFGMNVIALKRYPADVVADDLGLSFVGGPESLDRIMSESDFVLVSAVLTKETDGLVGAKQIARMKPDAFLINISRGELVDEDALVEALRNKKLAGAGLDVLRIEPVKPDNPLLKLENVILTPHAAGGSVAEAGASSRAVFLVNNVLKALNGGRPENAVDPVLKYAHRTRR